MDGLLVGFTGIALFFLIIDMSYHYSFYKKSLFKQLYGSYLEYYLAIKRKSDLSTTKLLENKIGKHKVVYVQSPNKTLGYYVLVLTEYGATMILNHTPTKERRVIGYQQCQNEYLRLMKHAGGTQLEVIVVTKTPERFPLQKKFTCIRSHELIQKMTENRLEKIYTSYDIDYFYQNLVGV